MAKRMASVLAVVILLFVLLSWMVSTSLAACAAMPETDLSTDAERRTNGWESPAPLSAVGAGLTGVSAETSVDGNSLPHLENGDTLPRLQDGETLPRLQDGETLPTGATAEWWAAVQEHLQRDDSLASSVEEPRWWVYIPMVLSPHRLPASPSWTATGEANSSFGYSVGTAGDVDSDGYADVVVGAPGYNHFTGRVYVYRGGAGGLSFTPVFTATGETTWDYFGYSVGTAGDVDGDGYADVIVGAFGYNSDTGRAYVY